MSTLVKKRMHPDWNPENSGFCSSPSRFSDSSSAASSSSSSTSSPFFPSSPCSSSFSSSSSSSDQHWSPSKQRRPTGTLSPSSSPSRGWLSPEAKRPRGAQLHARNPALFGKSPQKSLFEETTAPLLPVSTDEVEEQLNFRQRKRIEREEDNYLQSMPCSDNLDSLLFSVPGERMSDPMATKRHRSLQHQQATSAVRQKPLFSIEEVRVIVEKVVADRVGKIVQQCDQVLMERTQEQYHSLMAYLDDYIRRQDKDKQDKQDDPFSYIG